MRLTRAQQKHIRSELNKVREAVQQHGDQVRRQQAVLDAARAQLNGAEGWAQCLEDQLAEHDKAGKADA